MFFLVESISLQLNSENEYENGNEMDMSAMKVKGKTTKLENSTSYENDNNLTKRATTKQVIMSFLATLSVITTGIGLAYPAITTQILSRDDNGNALTVSETSWFASIASIAMPIGSLLSGFLTEKMGRRGILIFINIVSIASWLIIGFSSQKNVHLFFVAVMIGRAVIGVMIGMITIPVMMYTSEVCHTKLRGRLTLLTVPLIMSVGALVAYLLGYLIPYDFRLVSFISAGITGATLSLLFLIPESPVYLITRNKIDKARIVLAILHNINKNDHKIDAEIVKATESRNCNNEKFSHLAHWKEIRQPQLYKPFLIMVFFFAIQQFSGIFVILVYAAQFSIEAGVVMDPFLSTVIMGMIRCLTIAWIEYASDKFGRKPLATISGFGMFISMFGIILCLVFSVNEGNLSWLSTFFLFGFVLTGSAGIFPLPFTMVAEMYPQKSRGFALSITMCIAYLFSFIHIKLFSSLFEYFGNIVVFSFYTIISFVGALFAIFILPETKGKTLHEIEGYFRTK